MGDFREEMNIRFASLQNDLGGHVCDLRNHVTDEINVLRRRFDEVVTEIGQHNVADEYGGFGHDDYGGDVPRRDVLTPSISADKQNVGEATEEVVCNIPDVSITSRGGVGVIGSVYVACYIVEEAPTIVPTVDASTADPPTCRPQSSKLKKASANTKKLFT
ncbi:uncharacterized protein LOC111413002 [Olea europaea var. sylvestris]|uniref:uncharacterized protein LOC111413002 n=1 Tax=Olea europaea var. sylvestris TaxID=158386 RepID=UPI000C1D32BB|nr:uncharacterized protein LOC111413002 [Olea europaea var. sylvestris]XP_022899652.1 uncharacterized protein LOC111413002 [Olea europaea var. sylvestris]